MDYKRNFIEIPFGAKDSETLGWEYTIPDDMEAKIESGKIIVRKKESEDEKIRKWIYNYIERVGKTWGKQPITYTQILAWLEKQKPVEWSEEDETALQDALWCIEQARKQAKDENDMGTCWFAERWLKSLKPQNRWKPSNEQINALELSIKFVTDDFSDKPTLSETLTELYYDLKKLKEE